MVGPAFRPVIVGIDVLTVSTCGMMQLPIEIWLLTPCAPPMPPTLWKKPPTEASVRAVPCTKLVDCMTDRMPNFRVVFPARPLKTSGESDVPASEHVLPPDATGIVTELLTMLPLTMESDT